MLKMDYVLTKEYMNRFIEVNKEILEFVYAMQMADDEWFVCIGFEDGKVDELDIDIIPVDWEVYWKINPNTGEILAKIAEMRECGFLEQEKLPNIG